MHERGEREADGPSAGDYAAAELHARRQLDERNFTLLERIIVTVFINETFGRQRAKVWLPKPNIGRRFEVFRHVGISNSNARIIIRGLEDKLVVREFPEFWFGINVTWSEWRIEPRMDLKLFEEQLDLFGAPPDLEDALRETFVESAGGVWRSARANILPGRPAGLGGVLEEASERGSAGRPRVPDSGTVFGMRVPDSGTGAGDGGVERGEKGPILAGKAAGVAAACQNLARAEKGFPPTTPFPKALNVERLVVERSAVNAQSGNAGKEKPALVAKCSLAEERRVMELLGEWLGAGEMGAHGGMWRERWVRNCPDLVESEVTWGKYLEKSHDPNAPRSRAAWLMSRLALLNGVKDVGKMPRRAARPETAEDNFTSGGEPCGRLQGCEQ